MDSWGKRVPEEGVAHTVLQGQKAGLQWGQGETMGSKHAGAVGSLGPTNCSDF